MYLSDIFLYVCYQYNSVSWYSLLSHLPFYFTVHMAWTSLSPTGLPYLPRQVIEPLPLKNREKKKGGEARSTWVPLVTSHALSPSPTPPQEASPQSLPATPPVPGHHFPPWTTSFLVATASRRPAVFILPDLLMSPDTVLVRLRVLEKLPRVSHHCILTSRGATKSLLPLPPLTSGSPEALSSSTWNVPL